MRPFRDIPDGLKKNSFCKCLIKKLLSAIDIEKYRYVMHEVAWFRE